MTDAAGEVGALVGALALPWAVQAEAPDEVLRRLARDLSGADRGGGRIGRDGVGVGGGGGGAVAELRGFRTLRENVKLKGLEV